jgi:hypothetical protein
VIRSALLGKLLSRASFAWSGSNGAQNAAYRSLRVFVLRNETWSTMVVARNIIQKGKRNR